MKQNIEICDVCNKIVSENKCEICSKDICKVCQTDSEVIITGRGGAIGGAIWHFITCKSCNQIIIKSKLKNLFDEDVNKSLRTQTIKILKNGVMLKTLEEADEPKEEEEDDNYTNLLKRRLQIRKNTMGFKGLKGGFFKVKNEN